MRFLILIRNLLFVTATLALLAGCSISYSSGKSSDSVTSSVSSGGGDSAKVDKEINNYTEEVVVVTDFYVSRTENSEEFQRHISDIAGNHGIADWENEDATFVAMGKGLKRAGVDEKNIASLPYFASIAKSPKYALLLKGYQK
ncbi:MAG: putative lipoprotein [Pseudomonadota bacterium]|nr:putative lipoprotein [Pseudomonadota bacterium]